MSKERARAREARLAARQVEIAAAAEQRAKQARKADRRDRMRIRVPSVPMPVLRTIIVLVGVELIAALLGSSLRLLIGIAVVTCAVLFVYVVSARRSPTR